MNLPEQICNRCILDLEIAYRFRTNCESSEAILQSFNDSSAVAKSEVPPLESNTDSLYKFRAPSGLKVKKIPAIVKNEPESDHEEYEDTGSIMSSIRIDEMESEQHLDEEEEIIQDPIVDEELEPQESEYLDDGYLFVEDHLENAADSVYFCVYFYIKQIN